MRAEVSTFLMAVKHVKGSKRTFSCSDGWAMCSSQRLTELEIAEERLIAMTAAKNKAREALKQQHARNEHLCNGDPERCETCKLIAELEGV